MVGLDDTPAKVALDIIRLRADVGRSIVFIYHRNHLLESVVSRSCRLYSDSPSGLQGTAPLYSLRARASAAVPRSAGALSSLFPRFVDSPSVVILIGGGSIVDFAAR